MLRILLELLAAVIFWIVSTRVGPDLNPELKGMAIGTSVAFLIESIVWLYREKKYLGLYLTTLKPIGRKELRLTIAYLFKIESKGKYLLVKSNRIKNLYQPVGGVYKYFEPEAKRRLEKMGIITDGKMPVDEDNEFDLRLEMKSRIQLRSFLKWFHSKEQREIDPWREFFEELVQPGILPKEDFGFIYSELIGEHFDPIHYDQVYSIYTFKYADIYRPRYVNDAQRQIIADLQNRTSSEYIWATEAEIMRGRTEEGMQIAEHTRKIFCVKRITK
ncbi:MAG TPA: hypothetical protein VEB86_18040 [Chryseosolibacter sp.]|nr:hypothetical protein [Chryseosolibacter sp.]